jgi:hypothetical protein
MSLTALGLSFADAYLREPEAPPAGGPRGPAPVAVATVSGPQPGNIIASNLQTLTDYIPSEILTLYIAAVASIQAYNFGSDTATKMQVLAGIFWTCLILSPIWVITTTFLAAKAPLRTRAFVWPAIAALIAFAAYALAIPKSWLAAEFAYGDLFAGILLLIITPVLHTITLVYAKLLPP